MKRLLATTLALSLAAAAGTATAQTYRYGGQPYPDRSGQSYGAQYDYARVLRVDPVFDNRYGGNAGSYSNVNGQRCYENRAYPSGTYAGNGYGDGYYRDQYGRDQYSRDQYGRNDGYYDPYGNRSGGSQAGATVATVIGGLVGAAVGSQVGGGSARYATSAIGSMVGGMAGRQIYEQQQRQRVAGAGTVRVCDPVPSNGGYYGASDRSVQAYDVTYEYAGRTYTTRTSYHPGDRMRVRVDVRPE
ncbi:MAG: glycine zipper 2TM domain-containing protein [Pseudomonas sp.]|nr:glycine zipper 2TM domain-containing protein [Pseudomonas sp.]